MIWIRNNVGIRVLFLILPNLIVTRALNLDSKHPRIFHGPEDSYFGFSMDFYRTPDKGMNIVVGAPKMQTSQPNVTRGGGVFMCPWNSEKGNCTMIELDQKGDSVLYDGFTTFGVRKTDQWLGASVRTWKDIIVACAPMQHSTVTKRLLRGLTNTPTGACYITSNLKDVHEFAPCRDHLLETQYYHSTPDKRFSELGFSADIHKDGTFLAGGPGGNFFHGLFTTTDLNIIATVQPANLSEQIQFNPQVYIYGGEIIDTYKGFSVTFGEFVGNSHPELVIGTPTHNYMGIVEISTCLDARGDGDTDLCRSKVHYTFEGDQIAAYFGHTVAVVDVNNDGKDDVLIGAPLYMERRTGGKLQEVGRVYVYVQKKTDILEFEEKILSGFKLYGRFGSAISSLEDVDLDGFPDVAIGAPFGGESGGGCVYIYKGDISGLSSHPSQVLESPVSRPSRFGFSLRGGTDIDGNGYPDLLVGAFETGKVYVYRAQPVVVLHASLMFKPEALNPDAKPCLVNSAHVSCFTLHVCAAISGKSLPKNLNLIADVQLDRQKSRFSRRILFHDTSSASRNFTIAFQSDSKTICHNISAYLRGESEFRDKLSPIVVSVNMSLASRYSSDTVQPVLYGTTYLQNQTYILLDCGENNICIPDLHLHATWPSKPLLIGVDNMVNVEFVASNRGDGAYEAELYVKLPAGAHYVQVLRVLDDGEEKIVCTPKKENETEVVTCELGNPMKKSELHAVLQLTFSSLENYGSNITFPMQIKSRNSQNSSSPVVLVQFAVAVEASLELRGSLHPAEVVLPSPKWELNEELDKQKPQDYGEEVIHVYELHNAGPASVHVHLEIQSPERYQEDFFLYPLRLEVDDNVICYNQSKLNPLELHLDVATIVASNYSRHGDQRRRRRETDQSDTEKSGEEGNSVTEEGNSVTEEGKKIKPTIHLNCSGLPCWEVQCDIKSLKQGHRATLRLHSILWIPSYMKRPLQPFTLLSQGSFQVTGTPYTIQPLTLLANSTTAEMKVLWASPDGQNEIPLWWVIVGVLGGLLVLGLFIFVMWKLGFFKRMRPPEDDQADLTVEQTE